MSTTHSVLALAALACMSCAAATDDVGQTSATELGLSIADDDDDDDDSDTDEGEDGECANGPGQTPIDLPLRIPFSQLEDLEFDYAESHVSITNTGKTVQYTYDPGSALFVGDARYELVQFHFHAHSEHAIGGFLTPLELHLVHRDEADRLLVVGILIVRGRHHPTLDQADWPALPSEEGEIFDEPDHDFNVQKLVPGGPTYRYMGSLTAPPCTGEVSWIVYRRPIALDAAQIATFTELYPHNSRALQALGDRELVFGK